MEDHFSKAIKGNQQCDERLLQKHKWKSGTGFCPKREHDVLFWFSLSRQIYLNYKYLSDRSSVSYAQFAKNENRKKF